MFCRSLTSNSQVNKCLVWDIQKQTHWPGNLREYGNEARYLSLLKVKRFDFLEDFPLSDVWNVWFKHDGVPRCTICHVSLSTIETHSNNIWYGNCVEWLARSSDLSPFDYFVGIYQTQSVCNPSSNTAGTSKPRTGCL
ncbi:uncharacterized protein TNCV_3291871 [Trichonephila clavipes]|nr:uncharacterized protein TNCV_3291871 [Trichonephila clavipes]